MKNLYKRLLYQKILELTDRNLDLDSIMVLALEEVLEELQAEVATRNEYKTRLKTKRSPIV